MINWKGQPHIMRSLKILTVQFKIEKNWKLMRKRQTSKLTIIMRDQSNQKLNLCLHSLITMKLHSKEKKQPLRFNGLKHLILLLETLKSLNSGLLINSSLTPSTQNLLLQTLIYKRRTLSWARSMTSLIQSQFKLEESHPTGLTKEQLESQQQRTIT